MTTKLVQPASRVAWRDPVNLRYWKFQQQECVGEVSSLFTATRSFRDRCSEKASSQFTAVGYAKDRDVSRRCLVKSLLLDILDTEM
jgi:hypothetical protein